MVDQPGRGRLIAVAAEGGVHVDAAGNRRPGIRHHVENPAAPRWVRRGEIDEVTNPLRGTVGEDGNRDPGEGMTDENGVPEVMPLEVVEGARVIIGEADVSLVLIIVS